MHPARKILAGGAIAATVLTGGAIGASFLGVANAETATTATAPADSTATPAADAPAGPHQANGKTETLLTGTDAEKATAAAQAAVPGATIVRVETDADGAAYEAHVTKSDGTEATVLMDESFAVTSVEAGGAGKGAKGDHAMGPHQANGKTEEVLTGDDAAKATAAALAASPGATIDRVETDADGATYEAHITKADGTKATVLMDGSFTVTSVEAGRK
jgi:uncharacterized membrane protein YkoI